jgi:hypothetical protein
MTNLSGRGGWRGGGRPKKEGQVVFYKRMSEAEKAEMLKAWEYLQNQGTFDFYQKTEIDYFLDYAFSKNVHNGQQTVTDFLKFYNTKKYTMGWDAIIKSFKGLGRKAFELEYIRAKRDSACPDCGPWTYNKNCDGECKRYIKTKQIY